MQLIERMQDIYAPVFVLLLFVVVAGWMLHFSAGVFGFGWLFTGRGNLRREHKRALKEHKAVCAQCAYPVVDSDRCPECGASYGDAGVVTRSEVAGPLAWLLPLLWLASVALISVLAALFTTPLAVGLGNQVYWGAWAPAERSVSVEYAAAALPGAPYYEIQLNASLIVDEGAEQNGTPHAPLAGTAYLILTRNNVGQRAHIQVAIENGTWLLSSWPGDPPIPQHVPGTGTGLDTAAEAFYQAGGLDSYWTGSQQELADFKRLATMLTTGQYEQLKEPTSLSATGPRLVWHPNQPMPGTYISAWRPPLGNWLSITLGYIALSIPLMAMAIAIALRFVRR